MKELDLTNVGSGVAVELFKHEMDRISANIADVNTKPDASRKITLTFEFKPDAARDEVKVHISAKSTLVPVKSYSKTAYFGKKNGKPTLLDQDEKQTELFDDSVSKLGVKKNG